MMSARSKVVANSQQDLDPLSPELWRTPLDELRRQAVETELTIRDIPVQGRRATDPVRCTRFNVTTIGHRPA